MNGSYRVLLCDDHEMLRVRCREMLSQAPDLEIVGEAHGGHAGVELALALTPDLVLMDVDMPDLDGVEATRRILAERPSIKVLGHSAGSNWQVVREMLTAGASGYLVKGVDPDELIAAIRAVLAGGRFLSDKIQVPTAQRIVPGQPPRHDAETRRPLNAAVSVALVDASAIAREQLHSLLSLEKGISIAGHAASLGAGLALLRERPVDVLVSDLGLGQESALELLRVARREKLCSVAVILTDHEDATLEKWCRDLGADFYFLKPGGFRRVAEVCRQLIASRGGAVSPEPRP